MSFVNLFWNSHQRRVRAGWRVLIQGGLFFAGAGALTFLLGLAAAALYYTGGGSTTGMYAGQTLSDFLASFLSISHWGGVLAEAISLVMILFTCWQAGRVLDHRPFADFGFHFSHRWWGLFGFGLLLGAGLMAFIFVFELAAGWIKITGFLRPSASGLFWGDLGLAVILFICAGIFEELFVRGYQLRNLAEGFCWLRLNPRTALVIGYILSSIIFGLLHAGNPNSSLISTLNLFLAGLFLGLGYVLTGELALPIGLHITWNFFEGNVFGFPVSGANAGATFIAIQQGGPVSITGGSFGPEAGLLGILAIFLGALLIAWWVRRTTGRLAFETRLAAFHSVQNRA